jgi:hypothetical protein
MLTVSLLSRTLLVLEALLLLLPSLFGLIVFFGCFIPLFVYKAEQHFVFNLSFLLEIFSYLTCLLAFLSFYSFWHIYADVMTREFENGKTLNKAINLFAFTGFVLSIAVRIFSELKTITGIALFGAGILYVPTYLHLLFEMKRQTGSDYLFGTIFKAN